MGSGTKLGLVIVLILGVVVTATLLDRDIDRAPSATEQARTNEITTPEEDESSGAMDPDRFRVPVDPDPGAREPGDEGGRDLDPAPDPYDTPRELAATPENRYDGDVSSGTPYGPLQKEDRGMVPAVGRLDEVGGPEPSTLKTGDLTRDRAGTSLEGQRIEGRTGIDPLPPAKPAPADQEYTVAEGDTLWDLAVRFYGNGGLYRRIVAANPSLADENELKVGTQLKLPAVSPPTASGTADPSAATRVPEDPTGNTQRYTIQEGDTLYDIAENVLGKGSRWTEIAKLNPKLDPNRLSVGKQIRVPAH